jgi:hypothetical protein
MRLSTLCLLLLIHYANAQDPATVIRRQLVVNASKPKELSNIISEYCRVGCFITYKADHTVIDYYVFPQPDAPMNSNDKRSFVTYLFMTVFVGTFWIFLYIKAT